MGTTRRTLAARYSRTEVPMSSKAMAAAKFEMSDDVIIGDGGNLTVYERPDKSRYALDRKGGGSEWDAEAMIFGRARFDARLLATGRWEDSRSAPAPGAAALEPPRARRRGSRFKSA